MSTGNSLETAPDASASERSEEPLRPLEPADFVKGAAFGAALALIMVPVASHSAPEAMFFPLLTASFGLGFLAYLDYVTHLILHMHNLVFAVVTAAVLCIPAAAGYSVWGPAGVGAGLVFLFMLAVAVLTGFVGGGDIKLAPIPAAVLAVTSPLAAVMWLLLTFVACLIYQCTVKVTGMEQKFAAMAPFMAVALIPAVAVSAAVMTSMGLQ